MELDPFLIWEFFWVDTTPSIGALTVWTTQRGFLHVGRVCRGMGALACVAGAGYFLTGRVKGSSHRGSF